MSKIICEICGTSYPETAKQCPICGLVRPGDVQRVTNEVKSDGSGSTGYTYVKGGHFSKSNVKKRAKNENFNNAAQKKNTDKNNNSGDGKDNRGLVITAIILLLAVIGVVIYLAIRIFSPFSAPNDGTTGPSGFQAEIPCQHIVLDKEMLSFEQEGEVLLLNVSVEPKNTTDNLVFRSENHSVVTVNDVGKVTVVGEGTTNIVITCGDITKKCAVTVAYPEESTGVDNTENTDNTSPSVDPSVPQEELKLNRNDMTISYEWDLYDGSIPRTLIKWSSDNESIATIENGVVKPVANGTTNVHAEYDGQKASCIVRVNIQSNSGIPGNGGVSEDGGGITEDGGGSNNSGNATIVATFLNVRSGPGTNFDAIGSLGLYDRVTILEQTTAEDGKAWGRIDKGWISMEYVTLD